MQWPKTITVTEQEIDIAWLTEEQLAYYEALAQRLRTRYYDQGSGRQIFTLSGPPGAGKSVITALLAHYFVHIPDVVYVNLGLDAFHYANEYLDAHDLRQVKGRYDTYDADFLTEKLQAFKSEEAVQLPTYSRKRHEPIQNSFEITDPNVLMLLEGQWLLRNKPTWAAIRAFSSHNMFVTGSAETMRENVIKRHIRGGRTPEDAAAFYEQSDLPNTQEVLTNRVEPDETLLFYRDIG